MHEIISRFLSGHVPKRGISFPIPQNAAYAVYSLPLWEFSFLHSSGKLSAYNSLPAAWNTRARTQGYI